MGGSSVAEWTTEEVAARFAEAAETGRRLPRVSVQGYFNVWPAFAREVWESYPDDGARLPSLPPTPQAIDRMLETMRWVLWLEEGQRHLVWMRAKDIDWKVIARRLGCHRTTAWRAMAEGIGRGGLEAQRKRSCRSSMSRRTRTAWNRVRAFHRYTDKRMQNRSPWSVRFATFSGNFGYHCC